MNEKVFSEQLDIIAEEETPENLNLWEIINMELQEEKQKKQKRAPERYPWLRYVAAFVLLLGLGIASYVYYQWQGPFYVPTYGDSTLPESLVSNLNLSQTVEGVTISIDWAYADEHRAAIGMTTSYMSDVPFDPACATCSSSMSIETADGQEIPPAYGGGGGGGGGGPVTEPYLISSSSSASYDTSELVVMGDRLNLVITLSFDPQGQPNAQTGTNGGGGGGGGGGSSDSPEIQPSPTLDPAQMPVRNYRFEFSIPYYREKEGILETPMLDGNDVHFEISNLAISPSITEFDLCYSLPTAEEWYPNMVVYTGSESAIYEQQVIAPLVDLDGRTVYLANPQITDMYELILSFDYEAMQACGSFFVQAPYEGGDIEIMIPYLSLGMNDGIINMDESALQAEIDYFASLGIGFIHSITTDTENPKGGQEGAFTFPVSENPEEGYHMVLITEHPDTMTAQEAVQYLMFNWMRVRHESNVNFRVQVEN